MSRVCAVGAACVFPGVVSASLHAVTFDTIWSSEVRAIHSSRARPTTHPLVPSRPAHPRPHRRVLNAGDFAGCCGVAVVLPCGLTDGSASAEATLGEEGRVGF